MNTTGWTALRTQWFKDFQLWLFIAFTLFFFRLVLITSFSDQIHNNTGFKDILVTILMGLRFDGATAATWVLVFFLSSISCAFINWGTRLHQLRLLVATIYIVVAVLLFGVDIVFFYEYGDQFNQTLFGIADDDTSAILITIWKEYHPIRFLIFSALAIYLLIKLFRRWINYSPAFLQKQWPLNFNVAIARVVIISLVFSVFVFVARGSIFSTQPLRQHHAFASQDIFLNKTIMNPFTAIRYAFQQRMWMQGDEALTKIWPENDLTQALNIISQRSQTNIDDAIRHTVKQDNQNKPKHIFLIVLESHSGWTLWPEYRDMRFSPELASIADKGIYFQNFIPAGTGTMPSLNALFTGLPYSGLNVNYEPSALKTYPFSIADTFKRMGYKTRFYYGGFLGWQRVDNFATAQGFDELYGAGKIGLDKPTNEWGVNDEYLFDFAERTIDPDTPSFNLILTTSNHPPYDLDLEKIGFNDHKLPAEIKITKSGTYETLGHLWYTDQQTGQFVERISRKLQQPLFAITGDHTSRLSLKFPGQNIFQHTAVPLILYGPGVLKQSGNFETAGSHIDILPTLYELSAPAGFEYYAMGNNLLSKKAGSPAFGSHYYIANGKFYINGKSFPLDETEKPQHFSETELNTYQRAQKAISWYRVRKGPILP